MTIDELRIRIKHIEDISRDDEAAHCEEDDLRHEVLAYIAKGGDNAQELAKEVLQTTNIDFSRWCS